MGFFVVLRNMARMKTILITGGAGFIGSHLCKKYLDEGHRVICLDNLQTTSGSTRNIDELFLNPNFSFRKHDIIEPLNIREKIDWIFNFACSGSYTSYQYNPVHTMRTSVIGVDNMIQLALRDNARFIHASTSEIYGDPEVMPQKETYNGNVNSLGPRACYDEGKRAAETLCMDYHREKGVDVKIVRIFNSYGPNMDPNDGRAVTNFIINALDGKDLVIYGDGTYTRSFQYIDDLIAGIDKMMNKDDFVGPVNLGNPVEFTMQELAELAIKLTNSNSKIVYEAGATDDPKRRKPDISLAKQNLDWEPKVKLEEGLVNTIEYFKTVVRPEKKVLIFATTYYPELGPAEQALYDLSKEMPDTEFHIITSKFTKGQSDIEQIGTDTVHRIGFGNTSDKFLLPIMGVLKARKLKKEHNYVFVWSVMASYAGLAAALLKLMKKDVIFLISLADDEAKGRGGYFKNKFYNFVFDNADSVYVRDEDESSTLLDTISNKKSRGGDAKSFMNRVRLTYSDMLNKKEKKLARPK